jgi:hypothetical protein
MQKIISTKDVAESLTKIYLQMDKIPTIKHVVSLYSLAML